MRLLLPLLAAALAAPAASAQLAILDTQVNPANGHTYHLLAESNWTDAEAEAQNLGGHLVTINDAAENDWVFQTFGNALGQPRDLWIGLNDVAVEGTFVWTSGQVSSYTNWIPPNPSNSGGVEHYVHMYGLGSQWGPGGWNDMWNGGPGCCGGWSFGYYGVVELEGPGLTVVGQCGAAGSGVQADGMTPNGVVGFAASPSTAGATVPAGPCGPVQLALGQPIFVVGFIIADGNGTATLLPGSGIPAVACGWSMQALDLGSCTLTAPVTL